MAPVKKPMRQRTRTFLRQWREYRDRSQDSVAETLEIDRSTISRVERGESPYDQDLLERLALIYGCEAHDMLSINPLAPDAPRLVYSKVRAASPEKQREILAVVEAMLKAS